MIPAIEQRQRAVGLTRDFALSVCGSGVDGSSWVHVRDAIVQQLLVNGFETKEVKRRGIYREAEVLMRWAIDSKRRSV